MRFVLNLNTDKIAVSKSMNFLDVVFENEIEITEEQYNQINEFPLLLSFDDDGKVVSWEKTEIEYEPIPEPVPAVPTTEERIALLEDTINYLLGL